jgi:hypothetical protein
VEVKLNTNFNFSKKKKVLCQTETVRSNLLPLGTLQDSKELDHVRLNNTHIGIRYVKNVSIRITHIQLQ